ncbi:MAG: hypothetical protein FWF25_02445 [Propionibacteriaceae bacterium]|nr:hypothetical protein [Propionibacteriaceae bacterium]
MTHDPEAAWPLTPSEPGYFPGVNPAPTPPSNVMRHVGTPSPVPNARPEKSTPYGIRIAYLAIILGVSIPLTAIALSETGLIGLVVVWIGIITVASIAFGSFGRRS